MTRNRNPNRYNKVSPSRDYSKDGPDIGRSYFKEPKYKPWPENGLNVDYSSENIIPTDDTASAYMPSREPLVSGRSTAQLMVEDS